MNIKLSNRISEVEPYAFAEIDARVAQLKKQGIAVIDFGVGDPTSPTPNFVIDALSKAARTHERSGYPSYIGSDRFRQACRVYLAREFNVRLSPDKEIISTIGSKEAIFHFPLGFVNAGDVVICPTPGYPPYKNGIRFAGAVPYFAPLLEKNDFLIDFESIPKDIAHKAKIIWTNYPNSPTGKIAPKEWLEALVAWAHQYNIIIAADEGCYIDIYFDKKPVSILEIAKEGIITFYSLSKRNSMTGYRVGFCAGDERIISAFKKIKTNIDSGTPDFIQEAAIAALGDGAHIRQMREDYRRKRDVLTHALQGKGLPVCLSDATFYLWQRVPEGMRGSTFAKKLLEQGIIVTPGELISDAPEEGNNPGVDYVRFALVPPRDQVEEAAKRIGLLSL